MKLTFSGIALLIPICVYAATPTADNSFYQHAAEGGLAEVEMGNLAQQKASNPRVKSFGAMMVKDHSAANLRLKALAASKSIDLPTNPSMVEIATKTKLEALSGAAFDKSYIKDMIQDHEEDIALFKQEVASGQDPDAKTFAVATLPTLQAHLRAIKSIALAAGINGD